jgi:hypothetical protein
MRSVEALPAKHDPGLCIRARDASEYCSVAVHREPDLCICTVSTSLQRCANWTRCPSGLLRFIQGTRSIWFPAEYRTFCSCHMKRGWLQHTLSIACSRSLSMCGFRDCTFFEKRKRKPRISSWKMKAATCQTARCFDINSESSSHLSG